VPDFAGPIIYPSFDDQFEPKRARCAKFFSLCTQYLIPSSLNPGLWTNLFSVHIDIATERGKMALWLSTMSLLK
jgi:hypothetical protein